METTTVCPLNAATSNHYVYVCKCNVQCVGCSVSDKVNEDMAFVFVFLLGLSGMPNTCTEKEDQSTLHKVTSQLPVKLRSLPNSQ